MKQHSLKRSMMITALCLCAAAVCGCDSAQQDYAGMMGVKWQACHEGKGGHYDQDECTCNGAIIGSDEVCINDSYKIPCNINRPVCKNGELIYCSYGILKRVQCGCSEGENVCPKGCDSDISCVNSANGKGHLEWCNAGIGVTESIDCEKPCKTASSCDDCQDNDKRCSNNEIQVCKNGAWQSIAYCSKGCNANTLSCNIECLPNKTQCNENYIQICTDEGVWQNQDDKYCKDGCTDVDGILRCSDDNATCDDDNYTKCFPREDGAGAYHEICNNGTVDRRPCQTGNCNKELSNCGDAMENTLKCSEDMKGVLKYTGGAWDKEECNDDEKCVGKECVSSSCGNDAPKCRKVCDADDYDKYRCSKMGDRVVLEYCSKEGVVYHHSNSDCLDCKTPDVFGEPNDVCVMRCEPKTTECQDGKHRTCNNDGKWSDFVECPTDAPVCDKNGKECVRVMTPIVDGLSCEDDGNGGVVIKDNSARCPKDDDVNLKCRGCKNMNPGVSMNHPSIVCDVCDVCDCRGCYNNIDGVGYKRDGENKYNMCNNNNSCNAEETDCGNCLNDSKQCSGTTPQICKDGEWVDCTDDSCNSIKCECKNKETKCKSGRLYTCVDDAWDDGVPCPGNAACKDKNECGTNPGLSECDPEKQLIIENGFSYGDTTIKSWSVLCRDNSLSLNNTDVCVGNILVTKKKEGLCNALNNDNEINAVTLDDKVQVKDNWAVCTTIEIDGFIQGVGSKNYTLSFNNNNGLSISKCQNGCDEEYTECKIELEKECTDDEKKCDDSSNGVGQLYTCSDGKWVNPTPCKNVKNQDVSCDKWNMENIGNIESRECGECKNGDTQCNGNIVQKCIRGVWGEKHQCPAYQTCTNGSCENVSGTQMCNNTQCASLCDGGHCPGANAQCACGECCNNNEEQI